MTNPELDAWIAENVMGWETNALAGVWWYSGRQQIAAYTFSPTSSIADAWKVRDKVQTWGSHERLTFLGCLLKIISERLGLAEDQTIHGIEIILHVTQEDICLATMPAKGVKE